MSSGFRPAVNRPPPPPYTEALSYPVESSTTIAAFASTGLSPFNKTTFRSEAWNLPSSVDEPLYQTIPGDSVYLLQPAPVYSNIHQEGFLYKKFTYKITKTASGKPLIYLEAIPENLASSEEEMGVKTYAQLEVVTAGSEREGDIVYGRGGVTVSGVSCKDVQSNGKAVLVPINGTITPDRMIVDALLNEHLVRNECNDGSEPGATIMECSTNGEHDRLVCKREERLQGTRGGGKNCEMRHCDHRELRHEQVDSDMDNLTQALEDEDKCPSLDEDTPLLQVENETAQIETKDETRDVKRDKCKTKVVVNREYNTDSEMRAECDRLELKEHRMDRSTDHMTDSRDEVDHVIYSEPEYSSSDASISKYGGETPKRNKLDTCQKTLKRTHNGVDHTVFELSPSDSFYNSTDNVHGAEKDPSSVNSSEGLCRLGHSSGSFTESNVHHRDSKHPLDRETSVSFKKPLVEGPSSSSRSGRKDETKPKESAVMSTDSEPLFTSTNKSPSESTEAISTQLIMEDTRTYYRRKAADRGTLYCACCGVIVVATIVFLLIYFS